VLFKTLCGQAPDDVADTLDREAAAVRHSWQSARRNVQAARPHVPLSAKRAGESRAPFFAASVSGDTVALRVLLADNAVLRSHGGGKVPAFISPIAGWDRVLRSNASVRRKWGENW
jgi:RNA polymerase sigma-70 factor (ECF subfamily)